MLVNVAKAKRSVVHLGEHSGFVRGVDASVVVVRDNADSGARRALEVYVSCAKWREDLLQQDLAEGLGHWRPGSIQFDDVVERRPVELEKSLRLVGACLASANGKSI